MAEAKNTVRTTVTLELSEIEAQVVMAILGNVGGSPVNSYRQEASEVYYALRDSGVTVHDAIYDRIDDVLSINDGRPYEVS